MGDLESRLADAEKERDCLQRQMAASLPQVLFLLLFGLDHLNFLCFILPHRS